MNGLESRTEDSQPSIGSTQTISSGILGAIGGLEQNQQAKTTEKKAKKNRKKRHKDEELYRE